MYGMSLSTLLKTQCDVDVAVDVAVAVAVAVSRVRVHRGRHQRLRPRACERAQPLSLAPPVYPP